MIVFYYDNTFAGLLSAIFDAFKLKVCPDQILTQHDIVPLLTTNVYQITSDIEKFKRVSHAMKKKLPKIVLNQLTYVWLSELSERGILIFRYLYKVFNSQHDITTNFADPDVLAICNLAKKVTTERQYLMMFTRFNTIENNNEKIYFAMVEPRYNSIPLIIDFFQDRFADQKWAIFDEKRQYGYFYDLNCVERITLNQQDDLIINGKINDAYLSKEEKQFQKLWHRYCQAITIKERINLTRQRQFMPKRFWKHLPETWDIDP